MMFLSGNNPDVFDLQIKSREVKRTFGLVLFFHVLVLCWMRWGLPDWTMRDHPDLIIELGNSLPASVDSRESKASAGGNSNAQHLVERKKKLPDIGEEAVSSEQSNRSVAVSSSAATLGVAPVIDADYKAAYLHNPKPPYPPWAYKMKIQGTVHLLVEVMKSGEVGKVAIETSSGNELLDQSALDTVKSWQFSPAKKDGVVIAQVVRIPITFSIKNK